MFTCILEYINIYPFPKIKYKFINLLTVSAPNYLLLVTGRVITGLYCGIHTVAASTFIGEFSSSHIRGILGKKNLIFFKIFLFLHVTNLVSGIFRTLLLLL